MVVVTKGDFVWIEPSRSSAPPGTPSSSLDRASSSLPVGARVLDCDSGRLKVIDDQGKEEWLERERKVKMMHPTSVQGREDMIQLGDLHEAAILRNIAIRYREKLIYTYTGSILIAVNPYTDIPIYTADEIRMYRRRRIGELPPHIFAIADNAYTSMRVQGANQSIVISGESGAGKTESTKLVLQFLATVSGQHSWIEQQILEANPILEAFGNAKTLRNDNSSRFGKYIEVHFGQSGAIEGARIDHYLLEKSRIVAHAQGERNYHIFYCLLAGLSEQEKANLYLTSAESMYYLNQGSTAKPTAKDASDMSEIRSALKVLMFKEEEINSIFRLLAAVLHIGNIKFKRNGEDGADVLSIYDKKEATKVAKLLEVNEDTLVSAITTKTLSTHGDIVISALSPQAALDARDALAKGIYGRIFEHVVSRINDTIFKPKMLSTVHFNIGILDIFGFEVFNNNSFEQLCINYANEALQQFFVHHVFKLEQKEYDEEKINWSHISFSDNQQTLDLIAAKQMNILSLIDEESIFPKGTDSTLLSKLHNTHSGSTSSRYLRPKSDLLKAFGIMHYAGNVFYNVRGFLDKNRDTFSTDLTALISSSKSRFLVNVFDPRYEVGTMTTNRRKGTTVGAQFRKSLDLLMAQLSSTEPFFIRCIKPNDDKLPMTLERELVIRQLRNTGMLDAIRIRRVGYPIRHAYDDFVYRYRVLVPGIGPPKKVDLVKAARKICEKILGPKADFALGKTKVFLKDAHDLTLEQEYFRRLNDSATIVQKTVKGWLRRRAFTRQRDAAIAIQKTWRGHEQRKKYRKASRSFTMVAGFTRLQAVLRSRQLVAHYGHLRDTIVAFQARCRGSIVRRRVRAIRAEKHRQRKAVLVAAAAGAAAATAAGAALAAKAAAAALAAKVEEVKENLPTPEDAEIVKELFDFLPNNTKKDRKVSPVAKATAAAMFAGEDLAMYDFGKYAATYFQGSADATHSKRALTTSLLANTNAGSRAAALSVWTTILRFMGDIPEAPNDPNAAEDLTPVMTRICASLQQEIKQPVLDSNSNHLEEWQPVSSLDKLHFIIGNGILRPELRDEIYCQLCKQLNNNQSKLSVARGWILLSLCVGCFAPTDKLLKYLLNFVRTRCVASYAKYVEERLMRTTKNGTRTQPPSYLELQANKTMKPIVLAITLMDSTVRTVIADSASVASEICRSIAEKVGLDDRFGFSLYVALHDKVSSLGSGTDHVLDAISQCEQCAKEQRMNEKTAPWRLFFRKEIFAPWHDTKKDPISTSLIYEQVVRGIRYGEYRCEKEDDLAILCAQQYRIHENSMDIDKLQNILPKFLPEFEIGSSSHSLESWMQKVMHAYRKQFATLARNGDRPSTSPQGIKEEVVSFAKTKWPLLFSRFYESSRVVGPSLPPNKVIIAINWTGFYVVDNSEEILAEFSFSEIASVLTSESKIDPVASSSLTLTTIAGDEYVFEIPNAGDVKKLVDDFLQGLKKRSRYLVAINSQKEEDGRLEFERGDLLVLGKGDNGEKLLKEPEVFGENTRTGLQGKIRSENVYVLPTLTRPTANAMEMFPRDWIELPQSDLEKGATANGGGEHIGTPYTLEQFAFDNFKAPTTQWKRTLTLRKKEVRSAECWKFSREAITAPLLKKIHDRQEPSQEAVVAYSYLMKYMGDLPTRQTRIGTALTDAIFGPALKYEVLRDELYCQLMKQLTYNPSMISEERGWELMWLASGLVAPTQYLFKEISSFLRSRRDPISIDCLHRIVRMMKVGSRKFPPHQVEIDAIQHKTTHIFHKVIFPDLSEEAIEVYSGTRARDFAQKIVTRLGLKSAEGFALFIKFGDKVLSVPDNEFFFDFVRSLADFAMQGATLKSGNAPPAGLQYQVIFMRKLWLNATPGEDRVADLILHFHQELPKYLHGYHKSTKDEGVKLAALLLRARTREDRAAPLAQVGDLLSELVPKDTFRSYSKSDWKKYITREYETIEKMSPDDAKLAFLEYIGRWPTFGSSFFMVKQSSDPTLPEKLLVAINKNGVQLYNAETKSSVIQYPFTAIYNWTAGNTYFHITVGNLNTKASRLLLETSMAYKMEDLLSSYLSVLIGAQTRNPKIAIENQHI